MPAPDTICALLRIGVLFCLSIALIRLSWDNYKSDKAFKKEIEELNNQKKALSNPPQKDLQSHTSRTWLGGSNFSQSVWFSVREK